MQLVIKVLNKGVSYFRKASIMLVPKVTTINGVIRNFGDLKVVFLSPKSPPFSPIQDLNHCKTGRAHFSTLRSASDAFYMIPKSFLRSLWLCSSLPCMRVEYFKACVWKPVTSKTDCFHIQAMLQSCVSISSLATAHALLFMFLLVTSLPFIRKHTCLIWRIRVPIFIRFPFLGLWWCCD